VNPIEIPEGSYNLVSEALAGQQNDDSIVVIPFAIIDPETELGQLCTASGECGGVVGNS
jgi:hypothetical protein